MKSQGIDNKTAPRMNATACVRNIKNFLVLAVLAGWQLLSNPRPFVPPADFHDFHELIADEITSTQVDGGRVDSEKSVAREQGSCTGDASLLADVR